jgi:hypothetical protein
MVVRHTAPVSAKRRWWQTRRGCVVPIIVTLLAASWGCETGLEEPQPPPEPTAQDLARIRESASPPVFWLGSQYQGQKVTHAERSSDGTWTFSYGPPSCAAGSGCSYNISIATSPKRDPSTEGEICWRRLGRAWLLGCADYQDAVVLTGKVLIHVVAFEPAPIQVARAVRRLDTDNGSGVLTRPRRFSCDEAQRFPRRFRAQLPRGLRPHCR